MTFPARKWFFLPILFFLCLFLFNSTFLNLILPTPIYAQGVTVGVGPSGAPTSSSATWAFDPEVTEVGKNSERARQLLWWTMSHPGIHTTPVLAQLWAISRNIVYIFIILVIVALGLGLILSSRKNRLGPVFSGISNPVAGLNLPSVFMKVAMILIYVTFSYILILALIQISEILMRFFIENVGGKDLFNVIFAGAGNRDENYISFIGYSDTNPLNREMVNTSLFLIKLTSLTYFVMALIVILRTIILWFLLIVAPFLAILMPFVFIRNVGWIWIGVFFQWLFYGPLMALFLAAITRIWIFGIPFPFDFSRVNQASGQIYRTAINILYGGPAQTITPGNSANYIDTYAEYVIALVMLWTSVILPWLLLRIFRDYCCAGIAAAGATLNAIFDRIRQYPPPPPLEPVSVPVTVSGVSLELPFRQKIKEEVVKKTTIENIREITKETTSDIASKMDAKVSSLKDISRFEMDQTRRADIQSQLRKIASPQNITLPAERQHYAALNTELQRRAARGDVLAKSILTAGESSKETIIANIPIGGGRPGVYAPTISAPTVPTKGVPAHIPTVSLPVGTKTVATQVPVEDYEEVKKMWLKHYREAPVPTTENIKNREQWVSEEIKKLTNISNLLSSSDPKLKQQGLEKVSELLPFLLLGGFSDIETLTYLKAKLEAAKQIELESEIQAKAKEEAKKEITEEKETLLEVTPKKQEEKKKAEVAAEEKLEVPKEEKKSSN